MRQLSQQVSRGLVRGRALEPCSASPAFVAALYGRLGPLFQDFKAQPASCATYLALKLVQKAAKGALLGCFFGGWRCCLLACSPPASGAPHDQHATTHCSLQ